MSIIRRHQKIDGGRRVAISDKMSVDDGKWNNNKSLNQ
jgi:hypothetical protein